MRYIIMLLMGLWSSSLLAVMPAELLNERLLQLHTLTAKYIQTSYDPGPNGKKIVSGDVVMERPNKFRWRIEKPYHQVLLSDAKKFYIYDEDLDQVVVKPLTNSVQDAPALLLIGETGDVSKNFQVRQTSMGGFQEVFTLVPKDKESMIKSIDLTYRGSVLHSMRFKDTLDQVVNIEFTDLQQNGTLADNIFKLDIPKGVDVIEE
ncbi:MAG: outer membrane lipoprotein chaperone LolA [Gammaproteobacteria bacterium]